MKLDFTGKVVIVTGAGDGIGRAAALDFARSGAKLVVCLDVHRAEETTAAIKAAAGSALAMTMDVRDSAGWAALVERLIGEWDSIDVLVNNAGVAIPGDTAVDMDEAGWDRIMDINAKGVWLGMKHVLPMMLRQGAGKVCNVASTAAHIGLRDAAAYCASKGAVLALTRQAGVQYAPANIQINSVSPGTTMTGLQRDVTEAQRAAFLPLTPVGRFAEPKEVSDSILFLCSTGSSFITAADLSIDGGMVAV